MNRTCRGDLQEHASHRSDQAVVRRETLKLERYAPRIVGCRVAIERPQHFQQQGNAHRLRLWPTGFLMGGIPQWD